MLRFMRRSGSGRWFPCLHHRKGTTQLSCDDEKLWKCLLVDQQGKPVIVIRCTVPQEVEHTVSLKDEEMDDAADDVCIEKKPAGMAEQKWQLLVESYRVNKRVLDDESARETTKEFAVQKLKPLWYEGLVVAAHQVGKCYRDGVGVTLNKKEAKRWFRHAADAGLAVSQYALGKLLQQEGQLEEAMEWYKKAAAQGNRHAQYILDHWDNDHHYAYRKHR